MNRSALIHACRTVAFAAVLSLMLAAVLGAAIWLPTLALQRFTDLPFVEAYLLGAPCGLCVLTLTAIGVMAYRQKSRG